MVLLDQWLHPLWWWTKIYSIYSIFSFFTCKLQLAFPPFHNTSVGMSMHWMDTLRPQMTLMFSRTFVRMPTPEPPNDQHPAHANHSATCCHQSHQKCKFAWNLHTAELWSCDIHESQPMYTLMFEGLTLALPMREAECRCRPGGVWGDSVGHVGLTHLALPEKKHDSRIKFLRCRHEQSQNKSNVFNKCSSVEYHSDHRASFFYQL